MFEHVFKFFITSITFTFQLFYAAHQFDAGAGCECNGRMMSLDEVIAADDTVRHKPSKPCVNGLFYSKVLSGIQCSNDEPVFSMH